MGTWDGWPLERFIYLFLGAAWLLVWIQVTLFHWRGGFSSIYMYGPVVYTPLLMLVALLLAATRATWVEWLFIGVYAVGALEGLFGAYKHFKSVSRRVGGLSLRNFMDGPPVPLPIIYAALAAFGLIVFYWSGPA